MCVLAINTSVQQDTTKFTPFYLMYSRRAISPTEIVLTKFENEGTEEIDLGVYTVRLYDALESFCKIARARAEEVEIKMSVHYDQPHQYIKFKEGDLVLVYNPHRKVRTKGIVQTIIK